MSKRRSGVTILVTLVLALSLVCSTLPQTSDPVPLIITPGTDGIATVTPEYNVSITPPIVIDANTTFTDVVRLYCPAGYNDTIGIADLILNSSQIKELQIFVNYSNQKIVLTHYRNESIIQNNTFTLHPNTEAIMGISIIPTPTVINAGPIDSISYNIVCSYEVTAVKPVARFTVSPGPPYYAPATLTFNASDSTPNGGYIVNYTWNFGDLNITTVPDPIIAHTYKTNGTYTVTLNVTDSEGLWNTTSKDITVDRRDVAVVGILVEYPLGANKTTGVYPGWVVNISVTVRNNGTVTETFGVTVCYENVTGSYPIDTLPVTSLTPGNETTLEFSWNTTGVAPSFTTYTINATASEVPYEITTNNNLTTTIFVKMPGDIDGDGDVDFWDLLDFCKAYGGNPQTANWNKQADFDGDDDVDFWDLLVFCRHYGIIYR